jgi:acetoacetyl-CoA synthetase
MQSPLWTPSAERIANSRLKAYQDYLQANYQLSFANYDELYCWSVDDVATFWKSVWDFCAVKASVQPTNILTDADKFPGAKWFEGARFNFAENLMGQADESLALIARLENGSRREMTRQELHQRVTQLASTLRKMGVVAGDRVAGFMPNVPETLIAMLAATSIGAIWSSCSPDFGLSGVMDRFGQIQPKVLFACDGYFYNGKTIDCSQRLRDIANSLESLEHLVIVPVVGGLKPDDLGVLWEAFLDADPMPLTFEQLPFDHPLYIMYSSGTTGVPKCIVHSVGGTLLKHLSEQQLHNDIHAGDKIFYFTTCGWMMWNWLVSAIASGATLVLYDGSPFYPDAKAMLDLAEQEQVDIFGTSAKYIAAIEKERLKPMQTHDLSKVRLIMSTGSPLTHESFRYVYRDVKQDVCLSSVSGGTDILGCFTSGSVCLPVYEGELQCNALGMAVEFWNDEGQPITQEKGELVCIKPFPSAPIGFWNDPNGEKYRAAYFETYPNIWAHGDYGEITENGGVVIYGRSDAVLNPGGVRIGTAEIYRQVEKIDQVVDSLCIGQHWQDDVRVVLFVVMRPGIALDDSIQQLIRTTIRQNTTPRHVPAKIISVPEIPRTLSGKIVELAVRNVVHNLPVKNTDALANAHALEYFKNLPELQV